jgi:membrane-associated phospholipid phosphatase
MPAHATSSWLVVAYDRLRRHFWLKLVGTTTFICLFFVGYFQVLHATGGEATVMPLTPVDELVGFQPAALYAYISLWVYVGLPQALLQTRRDLVAYCAWIGALCLAGLACFWAWPTAVPPHQVDTTIHPGYGLIQGIDAPGNACPSLHVATAAFSAVWLDRLLGEIGAGWRVRAFNWAWFAAIAWSTLATKQHVALDVAAGILLALAFALPALRLRPLEVSPCANTTS